MAAAKALSCEASRADLRHRRITAVIAEKTDQRANRKKGPADGRPIAFDPERYRKRSTVEHGFRKVKTWRALATRYGTTPESHEAGLCLRGSVIWRKPLTSTTWSKL
ncbi:hypothetical protein ACQP10_20345 [Streptosporangium sandarakinum]|uniref:hypothetical protein n=1 Tax=Streptosporangium sandarakinum TaxID=1260955 RepID=UPI003D8F33D4